jgi:hypothetical protein
VGFLVRYAIGVSLPLWLSEGQYNEAGDEAGLQETVRFVHDVASRITGTVESASDASG